MTCTAVIEIPPGHEVNAVLKEGKRGLFATYSGTVVSGTVAFVGRTFVLITTDTTNITEENR